MKTAIKINEKKILEAIRNADSSKSKEFCDHCWVGCLVDILDQKYIDFPVYIGPCTYIKRLLDEQYNMNFNATGSTGSTCHMSEPYSKNIILLKLKSIRHIKI